jgi:hypothetical protein
MITKPELVCAILVTLVTGHGVASEARAQSPTYRPINTGDLLGGYIANGEWIETSGHGWFADQGVFFNANQISARVPMRVDVVNVDPETVRRLAAECGSVDQFKGGCRVTIRGQTGMLGDRQGIFARDIQIAPRQ